MSVDMHNNPLVSIITPFLNAKDFLQEAIESVISQTYDNWELLLIDDGSFDNSTKIAKHYAALYPGKIFYLEHENHKNLGASASRNLGLEQSQGEYIAFLDSDDIYLKNKLEEQVAILSKQSEAGALHASTEYWHSWTGLDEDTRKKWVWDSISIHPDTLIKPPKLLTMFLRNGGTVPCMGSMLVRREVTKSLGGWDNSFKTLYDDQVFNAKICLNYSVFVSSGCWDRYRQHPNSTCSFAKKTNQEYYARLRYLLWLENYLIDNVGNKDPELWKAFKFAIRPYREPYLHYLLKHYQTSKGWLKRLFDLT